MIRNIYIGNKKVTMNANASILIAYKVHFGDDLLNELQKLQNINEEEVGSFTDIILKVSYLMAKAGKDKTAVNKSYEEFISQFNFYEFNKAFNSTTKLFMDNFGIDIRSKENFKKKVNYKKK